MPGSSVEDRFIDLAALGVADSHPALICVPTGFGGASQIERVNRFTGEWYSGFLVPDGAGTFDLVGLGRVMLDSFDGNVPGGPEGLVCVPGDHPGFGGGHSRLLSEFNDGNVVA